MRPRAAPSRRTQAERSETTRERLAEALIDIVYESGFAAATVARVARRAGVTAGALQHHFASRADLVAYVIDSMRARIDREMTALRVQGLPVRERVRAILAVYWKTFSGRHYVVAVQIQLGTRNNPTLYARISQTIREVEREIDARWVAAFADGGWPRERLEAVRYVTVAAIRGMVIRQTHRLTRGRWSREAAVLVEMVERSLAANEGGRG